MGKIVLLDDLTINKIAAGEVIERPASCVKEMCENSIDAGSKNITVEIKNGGISLIKIIDDGCGISEDDMEIAFERHATSKIRSAEDLSKVKTMGFRGEALASIAAISHIEMISKRPEDEIGHRIIIEGGKVLEKSECAAPNGTTITVKNLFFNTPVRYKFLKKDFTESGYIEDAITRLALINKNVSFKLINTGKTSIQTIGNGDIKTIVYSIYGKDVSRGVTEVDYTYEDIRVTGVVGNTSIARSNRNGQVFFVNNRYVKDKTLTSSVDQAYKDILPAGKYGFVILNLEMDPSKVDCNVHPAKLEVRFEDEQKVFKAIYHAIKSKNDEIIVKKEIAPEIENQEKIENSYEKPQEVEQNVDSPVEKEEFKPRTGTFSGFFKKFLNEKSDEESEFDEKDKPTLIEDIFEARKNGELKWDDFDKKSDEDENNEEIKEEKEEVKEENFLRKETDDDFEEKVHEVKIGNTIISSDTKESGYNVSDLIKEVQKNETIKIDSTKMFSANDSKTEVIDSLKKIEEEKNKATISLNTEVIRNEQKIDDKELEKLPQNVYSDNSVEEIEIEENVDNSITEKLIEQKVKSEMEDTQFIDTAKVREELYKSSKEDIPMTNEFADMYKKVFGTEVQAVRKTKEEENAKLDFSSNIQFVEEIKNDTIFKNEEKDEKPRIQYRFIGTIFDNFAIIELKDEMYMIEKVAAEERLMYEVVRETFYKNDDKEKDSVTLLLPDIITLTQKEMTMSRDLVQMFKNAGFDYEEFGEDTIKLTKVPSWAEQLNTKKLFLEILREMNTVAITATSEKEEKFIATVASKYVAFSDTSMDEKEIEQLIKKLLELPSPFMYPNGRLTAIKITKANMEKKFSRR